jgi:hypothetical protein
MTARDFVRQWLGRFEPSVTSTFYGFSKTLYNMRAEDFQLAPRLGFKKYKKMSKMARCSLIRAEWRRMTGLDSK